ncbi:MAG: alpha/beta hydrolase [Actinomycetota bacterium]
MAATGGGEAQEEGTAFTVGGRLIVADVRGEPTARPTVVFEAGLGGFAEQWRHVQTAVAGRARTIGYDRAGMGRSEPGPHPRSPEVLVDELRQLLETAGVAPPYVLVGHSYGGLLVRCFAGRHPDLIAGLVLVDASHELQMARARMPMWLLALTRTAYRVEGVLARWPGLARVRGRRAAARLGLTAEEWERHVELANTRASFDTMRAETAQFASVFGPDSVVPADAGDLPLRVVAAGRSVARSSSALNRIHQRNQAELAQLSTQGVMVTVPEATHLSLLFDLRYAAVVADTVLDLLADLGDEG